MDHRFDLVLLQNAGDERLVGKVTFNQRPPAHSPAMAKTEVVKHHRLMPGQRQRLCRVTSNITSAAGNQYVHVFTLSNLSCMTLAHQTRRTFALRLSRMAHTVSVQKYRV